MKIGLIADTHDAIAPFDTIRDRLVEAFTGVELILHCGDLTTIDLLDRLEAIAPVVAVRSSNDPPAEPPRLFDGPHVLEAGGLTIGLVCTLGEGEPASAFDRPVDVVVHGGTHAASVDERGGVLAVNPGSPTLADEVSVAVLEIVEGRPSAVIVRWRSRPGRPGPLPEGLGGPALDDVRPNAERTTGAAPGPQGCRL